jgi:branched-chain amino acid aminotransferase
MDIKITKATELKVIPAKNELGFGKYFTDHMFVMDYNPENGWHNAQITPYAPLSLDPATLSLHYGQELFEGMKAYKTPHGISLFRPSENMKRMNISCERLCVPTFDEEFAVRAIKQLVAIDERWIPAPDAALYIRPFIIATSVSLNVIPSNEYKFIVVCSPSGAYYAEGLKPVSIYVEENYVRAVKGGLGFTKAGANYATAMLAQEKAHHQGFSQVLWLDGVERKYIEEVGAMNIFFVIGGEVVTPELAGSILPGITRKSVIEMLRDKGYSVSERRISVDELVEANKNGKLEEVFGTGTAAVIAPVGLLRYKANDMIIYNGEIGPIAQLAYDTMTGIQFGGIADEYGWTVAI